jgi:acyl carrier protein
MSDKLIQIVANTFEISPDAISDDTSPETLSNWNSLGSVRLLMALQEEFLVEFSNAEILAMRSVALIRRVLRKRGITIDI